MAIGFSTRSGLRVFSLLTIVIILFSNTAVAVPVASSLYGHSSQVSAQSLVSESLPQENKSINKSYNISVEGGTFSYDPGMVYAQLQQMVNIDIPPPYRIEIQDVPGYLATVPYGGWVIQFPQQLANNPGTGPGILAHEYVHSIHDRAFNLSWKNPDQYFAVKSAMEGGASYVEAAYGNRYLGSGYGCPTDSGGSPADQFESGWYYHGCRYVEARLDSPANLSVIYEDRPNTSEQVLHNLTPGGEPPVPLRTRLVGTDANSTRPQTLAEYSASTGWRVQEQKRIGEIAVRLTLGTVMNGSATERASTGWGNDRLVKYWKPSESAYGFAWVLRWDDAQNATEFARGFAEYRQKRQAGYHSYAPNVAKRTPDTEFTDLVWGDSHAAFRLVRVDDTTTVVFVGPPAFVQGATAVDTNQSVTVAVNPETSDLLRSLVCAENPETARNVAC